MRKFGWFLVILLVIGILGGGVFLAFWGNTGANSGN